jgi:hypothetical protein
MVPLWTKSLGRKEERLSEGCLRSSGGEGREVEVKWGFRETVEVRGGNWGGGMQSFKIKLKVFRKPFTGWGKESCIPKKLLIKC